LCDAAIASDARFLPGKQMVAVFPSASRTTPSRDHCRVDRDKS
jgi:hypothetical protein